ncbi:hypothetical protein MNB_SM-7-1102 [hydrothermal vent metagenome]|uniref:OmpA-like domain-containing protein n=1 Tax=hydrothermal vent metagenome TaxID=652676 RepID=A0A1W1BAK1_9ZZZZ
MPQEKKNISEEKALENALSPIINKLIDKNFENSKDKIASQMAPLMGKALREQIKSQKDDIIDALYPIMGNMISKFVTKSLEDLLNKINDQIQNGLSVKAIKRKIKAKIKGVSETELLLQENSQAKIKSALLIHKESGALLCKVEDNDAKLSDADMLASMMTAIRSFVNDWIQSDGTHKELGEIEYGGNKIILEASGYSYLAVIVEGAVYIKTYEKIRSCMEQIITQHGEAIQNFQGNFKSLNQDAIRKQLQTLFEDSLQDEQQSPTKKSPLLYILPFLLLLYVSYHFYKKSIDENLREKIYSQIEAIPQLIPFKLDVTVDNQIATIIGRVPFAYHKKLLEEKLQKINGLKKLNNKVVIIPTLTDPMQVSANIAYLIKGVNILQGNNITYSFDYNTLTLSGSVTNKKTKEQLLDTLKQIDGIEKIKEDIGIDLPKIDTTIYFNKASTQLDDKTKEALKKIVQLLKSTDISIPIELKAYSDMIGSKRQNKKLAKKRLEEIKNFLYNKGGINNKIIAQFIDAPPPNIDASKDPSKARCVQISLKQEKQ